MTDHGAEATRYLRAFIGEHYHYSEKPVFRALWDNYNDCQFVEDEGASPPRPLALSPTPVSALAPAPRPVPPRALCPVLTTNRCRNLTGNVLFYRNKKGQAVLRPAARYRAAASAAAPSQPSS